MSHSGTRSTLNRPLAPALSPTSKHEAEADLASTGRGPGRGCISSPRIKRASAACKACRLRKTKCSGNQPCESCTKRHTECVLDKSDDRRRLTSLSLKRHIEELQRDREMLHKLLAVLRELNGESVSGLLNVIYRGESLEVIGQHLDGMMSTGSPNQEWARLPPRHRLSAFQGRSRSPVKAQEDTRHG